MKKNQIIRFALSTAMALTLCLLMLSGCSPKSAKNPTSLPLWERKSAPAVIQGRYVDWKPGDSSFPPGIWGNNKSLKGGSFPEITTDSTAGTFTIVWDICYPLRNEFTGWSVWLCPGDTVKLDINRSAYDEYNALNNPARRDSVGLSELQALWQKAVHMEGATFEPFQPVQLKQIEPANGVDYAKAHLRDSFDDWHAMCWDELQDVLKNLDSLSLSPREKEFYRINFERDYIEKLKNFLNLKTAFKVLFEHEGYKQYVEDQHLVRDSVCITDDAELDVFRQQYTLTDPHAAELTFYRSITGFYASQDLEYLRANGLENSPLGQFLTEVEDAKAVMGRAKALEPVTDEELNALSPEFQTQIREVIADLHQDVSDGAGVRRDLPAGEPSEWLPKIVAEHHGRILFVDFWATWCGPCRMGMEAMEQVKDELRERGVDFVYITDTSSDSNEWTKYIRKHAGDHYIVPKDKMKEMQIPDYESAIPHYLLYDRDGNLAKTIVGWPGVEEMMKEFAKIK